MDTFKQSAKIASFLVIAVFVVLLGRLFWLQVLDFQGMGTISSSNSVRRIRIEAPRGRMIDRTGEIIVDNQPLYSIKAIPSEFKTSRTPVLAWLVGEAASEIEERLEKGRAYSRFAAVTLKNNLDAEAVARVSENLWRLPGVFIEAENKRKYADSLHGSHLFGYLRSISKEQLAELPGYSQNDDIGYSGLERQYEELLRGTKGARFEMVTPLGKVAGQYDEGKSDIPVVAGNDLYLSIDGNLQRLAEKLLGETGKSGAIVAMDPQTGGILALASAPDYDLNIFNGTTDAAGWHTIITNPDKPLFNRTLQAVYPPGSTYKMVLATAALEEKKISAQRKLEDRGFFTFGNRRFNNHGAHAHGMIDMHEALIVSSNVYFFNLMFLVGFEDWTRYGSMFGFGRQTGIDLPGERSGLLPSEDYYDQRYGKGRWTKGYLVSLAIGQGELGATPVQLTAYTAAIANGGTLWQPHIASSYRDTATGKKIRLPANSSVLPISGQTLAFIRTGMEDVIREGTGQLAAIPGIRVAGKTGTAQNPHGRDHAWFIAFAPVDDPKIAITVLVENAGFGGSIAAPIAKKLMQAYLTPKSALDSTKTATPAAPSETTR